ncbi:Tellurite resistance protein TerB [Novipirellula aureliae]|uniref:Tellurite resistance protein TerB n=2 Tax=Novipirellula aureliae TaxID=2527966 RepID=A0A5C6DLD3_9BACT|nr:Tellurite resistance protein TerB [Novipirellula aureliae]
MILIGTMNLTRTRDRGSFYCPTCRTSNSYRLRARRPFLTLYFIPTVPIGGAEEFVQCDGCRSTWDITVLEMNRKQHEAILEGQYKEEVTRACVLVALADDYVSETEVDVLLDVSERWLDWPMEREELGHLCSVARENKINATNYVLTTSRRWSQSQKRQALQAMFLVASAEGEMGEKQIQILSELRTLLEMTEAEYAEAIEEAISQA